jgi:iron complex transport system ATP-binding protein
LIKTLSGIQVPLSGQVFIEDKLISKLSPQELATKLSLVLTETVRSWNLDVYSLISLGRFPYTGWLGNLSDEDLAIINFAIEAVNLLDFINRKVDELSDGEKQRVMLARALVQDTGLIILDEPTAHLDIPNRISLMGLLHTLSREQHKAILISTHELDLALQIADEIWLFDGNGNLITGTPEELVMNDHFSSVFDKKGTLYDKTTGVFKMNAPTGPVIEMLGEGIPAFWTRRALERIGYRVSQKSENQATSDLSTVMEITTSDVSLSGVCIAPTNQPEPETNKILKVSIQKEGGNNYWILCRTEIDGTVNYTFNSINELLIKLENSGIRK